MTSQSPRRAFLIPVTPEARAAVGGQSEVRITRFPFTVGRESRLTSFARLKDNVERRLGQVPSLNELYLLEPPAAAMHISREHFVIEEVDGGYVLADRGSAGGTIVAGSQVGGQREQGDVPIEHGDVIVVGTAVSPYVFRFEVTGPEA